MSSSSNPQWIHDVFLSFRGEDTRKNFVSHLYAALSNSGVNTFLDDEKIERGTQLVTEIWRAIEGSRICIVVFSKSYAQSSWCLHELVKIMECHRYTGQIVLPVFYDVDPSHVRRHKGAFGEVLGEHARKYPRVSNFVELCKRALSEAGNLAGWDVRNFRNENKVVNQIVGTVLEKLDISNLIITDYPVGLESRVQDVLQFLETRSTSACVVGIWGMGGIGKTTIAKAIYNKIHRNFGDKSFLENIREVWEKDRGQIDLQEQLLSDILKMGKIKVQSIERGKVMIKERLSNKRVLVVLDDVNHSDQLNALSGNCKWIGAGSVIIVTTRDVRIINVLKVDYVLEMKEMDENESLELFSWHAFREASPVKDFFELSKNVVAYSGGLPLALEVLGPYLYERTKEEWQSVLSKLEKIPNDKVQEKLRISFDGLSDHMKKDIFLDICCFFIGKDRAYVTQILNGCGLHAEIGITILIERCLIKVERNNKLVMHALLRDMGREIIRESFPDKPEKRSRLWFHEDVLDVLKENTGTEDIKGLALKLKRTNSDCFNTNTFKEMKRLRLLQLDHVQLTGDYGNISRHLRWVNWQNCTSKYIPNKFYQQNLVVLEFKYNNLKVVWKEPQLLQTLKILNLSHSRSLSSTPDFSKLPNLERLILKDCPYLHKVHESIGNLRSLVLINFKDCTSLNNLPRVIYKLKSLKILILSGCLKIDKLEEDIGQMESLTTLIAENTAVKQVPFSIVRSKSIGYISLCGLEGLARDVFPYLIWSWMSPTMDPVSRIPPFRGMSSSLVSVDVQNYNLGEISPVLTEFLKLRSVWVQCHSESQLTQELGRIMDGICDVNISELEKTSDASASDISESEHSLRSVLIGMGSYHQVLSDLSNSMSQGLANGSSDFSLPGDKYQNLLTHTGEGHSVTFKMPQHSNCHLKGMTLCVVYSSTHENMATECLISVLIANYTKYTIQIYKRETTISFTDEEWLGILSNLGPGDLVEILVACGHGLTVKKTSAYLIYGESASVKIEPPSKPKESAFKRLVNKIRK
ncbi:hypothetical protein RJT34_17050 [Clitoria ternatea]|uniref:TIR domain-containing protein n=1 Tax=Clitoria ternatea TaxID=43366 RepID=A0AAN9J9V2_CLITE